MNCETAWPFKHLIETMDAEKPFMSRTEGGTKRLSGWIDLPPAQVGLAAALRRAFDLPCDKTEQQFEQLLRKLC